MFLYSIFKHIPSPQEFNDKSPPIDWVKKNGSFKIDFEQKIKENVQKKLNAMKFTNFEGLDKTKLPSENIAVIKQPPLPEIFKIENWNVTAKDIEGKLIVKFKIKHTKTNLEKKFEITLEEFKKS